MTPIGFLHDDTSSLDSKVRSWLNQVRAAQDAEEAMFSIPDHRKTSSKWQSHDEASTTLSRYRRAHLRPPDLDASGRTREVEHDKPQVPTSEQLSENQAAVHSVEHRQALSDPESSISPCPKTYSKRPRRKTRADRYETHKTKMIASSKKRKSTDQDSIRRHRLTDSKDVMERFTSAAILSKSIVTKPGPKNGLLFNGRTSKVPCITDLSHNQMHYLQASPIGGENDTAINHSRPLNNLLSDNRLSGCFDNGPVHGLEVGVVENHCADTTQPLKSHEAVQTRNGAKTSLGQKTSAEKHDCSSSNCPKEDSSKPSPRPVHRNADEISQRSISRSENDDGLSEAYQRLLRTGVFKFETPRPAENERSEQEDTKKGVPILYSEATALNKEQAEIGRCRPQDQLDSLLFRYREGAKRAGGAEGQPADREIHNLEHGSKPSPVVVTDELHRVDNVNNTANPIKRLYQELPTMEDNEHAPQGNSAELLQHLLDRGSPPEARDFAHQGIQTTHCQLRNADDQLDYANMYQRHWSIPCPSLTGDASLSHQAETSFANDRYFGPENPPHVRPFRHIDGAERNKASYETVESIERAVEAEFWSCLMPGQRLWAEGQTSLTDRASPTSADVSGRWRGIPAGYDTGLINEVRNMDGPMCFVHKKDEQCLPTTTIPNRTRFWWPRRFV